MHVVKKSLVYLVVVVMVMTLAAGCGGSNNSSESDPPVVKPDQGAEETPVVKASEKRNFSMLVESHPSWPYSKDWPVWKMIEEKTNVTFDVQVPSGKLEDTLSLTVASGSMPDIMYTLDKTLADKYGQQGALANILDYVDVMPNFKKWMEKYPDETKYALSADGKMYIFPNEGISETNRMIWMHREDIFKKHNLKTPTTYDELYEVAKQLKQLYPDSYPFAFRFGKDLRIMRNLTPAFNTNEDYYYDFDKKEWRYGPVEDNYKTLVEYLNKFYKEGLMPPDWLTLDVKQWQDMVSTDKTFMTVDFIGRIDFFNVPLRENDPSFTMAYMAPPAGPGGSAVNAYTHFKISGMMVASTSKQIREIMQFVDFYYSEEGRTMLSWGKENETYKVENGKKQFVESYADAGDLRKRTGLSTNGTFAWFDYDAHLSLATPELQKTYELARQHDSKLKPQLAFTEEEMEVLSTTGEAINKHRDENISKFILNIRPLSEWSKFVEEQEKLGVDKVLAIYKQAYDRMSSTSMK